MFCTNSGLWVDLDEVAMLDPGCDEEGDSRRNIPRIYFKRRDDYLNITADEFADLAEALSKRR